MIKNKIIPLFIFTIISFFIFRHCTNIGLSLIETISSYALYPLLRVQRALIVPLAHWVQHKKTITELQDHVELLRQTNEELSSENTQLKAFHLYMNETAELRAFNKRYKKDAGHIAYVLARHFSPTEHFFLVDMGSTQGIKKDMVAVYGTTIVGKVTQVYPWYCKVCLITDADCKVAASCLSAQALARNNFKKAAHGIHEGCNDIQSCTVQYVSHLESVKVGDTVISSGEGLVFPKGFSLGTIATAEKGELFYAIAVKPLIDFHVLNYCTLAAREALIK
jgi:rod shape-determining protein MreC